MNLLRMPFSLLARCSFSALLAVSQHLGEQNPLVSHHDRHRHRCGVGIGGHCPSDGPGKAEFMVTELWAPTNVRPGV